jgi:hypothetical protein
LRVSGGAGAALARQGRVAGRGGAGARGGVERLAERCAVRDADNRTPALLPDPARAADGDAPASRVHVAAGYPSVRA